LYSFVFILIQLKDFALLAGSLGLFVILAGIMFISRRIQWEEE
jgi:inner membrane protein